jgi:hypothetical protein
VRPLTCGCVFGSGSDDARGKPGQTKKKKTNVGSGAALSAASNSNSPTGTPEKGWVLCVVFAACFIIGVSSDVCGCMRRTSTDANHQLPHKGTIANAVVDEDDQSENTHGQKQRRSARRAKQRKT